MTPMLRLTLCHNGPPSVRQRDSLSQPARRARANKRPTVKKTSEIPQNYLESAPVLDWHALRISPYGLTLGVSSNVV
jgi:hypothetical protein